ncbi:hypothetical protein [Streptosporangium sp. NPDC002721]|uniref:hypothetical protein n=1 Tax=Streptosporangium sp. NPDC002721 TaxID=3366188 RepID=UPI0036858815
MLNPAIAWLEAQADAYHAAHQDPALRGALPPVPAYLAQPGVDDIPPRVDDPDELRARIDEARAATREGMASHG